MSGDEGYQKDGSPSSAMQMVHNASALVGVGLSAWWAAELLKPQVALKTPLTEADTEIYRIVNTVSMLVCLIVNGTAHKWQKNTQQETVKQWDVRVTPAGFAFAIWGVIYLLLIGFTIYQALPLSWVTSRNDELIFGQIGWLFAININLNTLWLVVWQFSTATAFFVDLWVILAMDVTGFAILYYSITTTPLNTMEFIFLRCGFSVYQGWVTAATILNIAYCNKANGYQADDVQDKWAIIYLWIGFAWYNFYAFFTSNPVYGLIFLWVLKGSKSRSIKEEHPEVTKGVDILMKVYAVTYLGQIVYCAFNTGKSVTMGLRY